MFVQRLWEITRNDRAIAGGKGANLGELVHAGFAVPDGFVVTTSAYLAYVERCGIGDRLTTAASGADAAAARALFDTDLPSDIADVIAAAYVDLGDDVAVAVRSSATAEDLPDASFAGQQDSYLNIRGTDAVLDAVRRCWASLWTERAVAYRAQAHVHSEGLALAVVVQRLVAAEAAGVMFTANPTNGRRDEVVIDAAFGLGEAVVAGAVTPDALVVRDDEVICRNIAVKRVFTALTTSGTREEELGESRRRAAVLDDDQALELARLGLAVAEHMGGPQDIEWTLSAEGFALVQSRPITALPEPTGPVPDTWPLPDAHGMYFRASIVEQLPDPLTPLFASLIQPAVATSLASVLTRYFGKSFLRPGDLGFPMINGYAYYYYSRAGMLRLLAAAPMAVPFVLRGGRQGGLAYWAQVAHPAYVDLVAEEAARDEHAMTAVELLEATGRLVDAGALYYTAVQAVIPLAAGSESIFTGLYDRLAKRPGDPPAATFVLGSDSEPLRADASLYDLAQWCVARPEVGEALIADASVPGEHAQEFEARLETHLRAYGHSVYNLDLAFAVPADDPAPVLAALRFYLSSGAPDPRARRQRLLAERETAQRALFARLDPVRAGLLRPILRAAQRMAPAREDALADVGLGWPAARRFARELGSRLATGGAIAGRDDVFWLGAEELADLADLLDAGKPLPAPTKVIAERRAQWRGRRRADPPSMLPQNGWMRVWARWMPSVEAAADDTSVLVGLGASGGRVEGPARLLLGPDDFASMRPGEVLVAPITTPAYTPFFAMAAAVVTDIGGPLSHSSIVAREYGIPAVLGTGSATRRITTGMRVVVDGDRGRVVLEGGDETEVESARAPRRRRRRARFRVAGGSYSSARFAHLQGALHTALTRGERVEKGRSDEHRPPRPRRKQRRPGRTAVPAQPRKRSTRREWRCHFRLCDLNPRWRILVFRVTA